MTGTPNNLGSLADQMLELRTERIALERQAKELKSKETELQSKILEQLAEQGLTKAGGKISTVSVNSQTIPTVTDWSKVEKFVLETGRFYLLQRRISNPAYIEMLEHEGSVPGIDPTILTKLSLTRSSK